MLKRLLVVVGVLFFTLAQSQSLCENGIAAGQYPCKNVDLLSHLDIPALGGGAGIEMNDIWGWTDPSSGREFVMIGKSDGTAFVEVSNSIAPIYLGTLPTHSFSSIWRDIKVYDNHAYIVSEAANHGMQVFDLSILLTAAPGTTFSETAHYNGFGNAHNVVINPDVARAYAVGTGTFSGGLHIVNIADPLNPVIAGSYADDGYTHDAQVVTYAGPDVTYQGQEIAFNANEDAITIVNVDDPTDTQTISTISYSGTGYTHQCWLTDDEQFLLVNDELDEQQNGTNTRTFIFDVTDLDNPVYVGLFESLLAAIDHNLYNDANLCYQANYRGGLRILDLQDVAGGNLNEVAHFDMYPSSDSNQCNGAWSSYPYFPSGIVAVSHIEEGLFMLQPRFIDISAQDDLVCFTEDYVIDISIEEGFVGPVSLSVVGGLPTGATAVFSQNNVGVGQYTLTLSNLPQSGGDFQLTVAGEGTNFTYRDSWDFEVFDCVNNALGCTDPTANNFNPNANIDDGSCTFDCFDFTLTLLTDNYPSETSWTVTDASGLVVALGGSYIDEQTQYIENFCLVQGCYTLNFFDTYGDGMQFNGVVGDYQLTNAQGAVVAQIVAGGNFGSEANDPFCAEAPTVLGCTDVTSCNYDPAATTNDGSCVLPDGCTDATACNYDPTSTCDDGSCLLPDGCTDATACNYDPIATCDDGSCIHPDGCTDVTACNYDPTASCDDGSCTLPDGCTDTAACNYDPSAVCDDGSCLLPDGCTNPTACNFDPSASCDDSSCLTVCCPGDFNADSVINASDLLALLGAFGCNQDCGAPDMNSDGIVSAPDILLFLGVFGTFCD